jgi:hypothetical protein
VHDWLQCRILADYPEVNCCDYYAMGGDDGVAVRWRKGSNSHPGDGRSIVESVEFLPAAE